MSSILRYKSGNPFCIADRQYLKVLLVMLKYFYFWGAETIAPALLVPHKESFSKYGCPHSVLNSLVCTNLESFHYSNIEELWWNNTTEERKFPQPAYHSRFINGFDFSHKINRGLKSLFVSITRSQKLKLIHQVAHRYKISVEFSLIQWTRLTEWWMVSLRILSIPVIL